MDRELIGWFALAALVVIDIVASYAVMRSEVTPARKAMFIIAAWLIPVVGPIFVMSQVGAKRRSVPMRPTR